MKNLLPWLIFLSICFVILDYFDYLSPAKYPVEKLVIPIKQTVHSTNIEVRDIGTLVFQYPSLTKKFEDFGKLQKKNDELIVKVEFLTEENKALRDQLQAPLPPSFKFIPAPVLSSARFIELGVGEGSGVKEGMAVIDGTVLIGKIVAVSPLRSSVMLPTDSEAAFPAKTSRGARGTVFGQFGQGVNLGKVLQKDPLFLGDQVFTSGEGEFPPNLLIGKISHISIDETSVYKQAKVEVPLDFKREKLVFVVSSL